MWLAQHLVLLFIAFISFFVLLVSSVHASDIPWSTLTAQQLSEVPAEEFSKISSAGLASIPSSSCSGFQAAQISNIYRYACSGFQASCFENIPSSVFSGFKSGCLGDWDQDQVHGISSQQVAQLTPEAMSGLKTALKGITGETCSGFYNAQLAQLQKYSCTYLESDCFSFLTANATSGFTSDCVSNFDASQVQGLGQNQMSAFSPAAFAGWTSKALASVQENACSGFKASQIEMLYKYTCSGFAGQCLSKMLPESFSGFTSDCIANIYYAQLDMISQEQISQLTESAVTGFSAKQMSSLNAVACSGFSKGQVSNFHKYSCTGISDSCMSHIPAESFAGFTSDCANNWDQFALSKVSSEQMTDLSESGVSGISQKVLQSIEPSACAGFTNKQLSVVPKYSCAGFVSVCTANIPSNQYSGFSASCTAQFSNSALQQISAIQLKSFTPEALSAVRSATWSNIPGESCSGLNGNLTSGLGYGCSGITAQCIQSIKDSSAISALTNQCTRNLPTDSIAVFSQSQLAKLSADGVSGFNGVAFIALVGNNQLGFVDLMTLEQVSLVTRQAIYDLTRYLVSNRTLSPPKKVITKDELSSLTWLQLAYSTINSCQATLNGNSMKQLPDLTLQGLRNDTIVVLPSDILSQLSAPQIHNLLPDTIWTASASQITSISPENFGDQGLALCFRYISIGVIPQLTDAQLAHAAKVTLYHFSQACTCDQFRAFTEQQLKVIQEVNPDEFKKLDIRCAASPSSYSRSHPRTQDKRTVNVRVRG